MSTELTRRDDPPLPVPEELDELERRFAVAFVELSLARGSDKGCAMLAYRRAFPHKNQKYDVVASRASEYMGRPAIRAEVQRLRRELTSMTMAPSRLLVSELEKIATANPADFMTITDKGEPNVDLSCVPPEMMAVIQAVDVQETFFKGELVGRKVTLKLHDKQKAIDTLLKLHGLLRDGVTMNVTIAMVEKVIKELENELDAGHEEPVVIDQPPADAGDA